MTLMLVRWQILPEDAAMFVESWTREFVPTAKGLIREFLTSVDYNAPSRLLTLDIANPDYATFITIGLWTDTAAFEEALRDYRDRMRYTFRCGVLDRLALDLVADRCGDVPLPVPTIVPDG
jgi:hypothetical protein